MPKAKKGARGANGSDLTMRNAAQTLLANIRFASVDKPICSVVVTSAVPNEGKSTIAIQLSRAIASGGGNVLLVECDMRRRSLAGMLGVHAPSGLYGLLSGVSGFTDSVVQIERGLYFIDVEPHIPNPPEIIASNRFRKFVEDASERFDYVIFDSPPVAAFVDAAVLSSVADATVLVVRERHAKKSELRDAYEQLVSAGANVIGVAMNFCREEKSEYYYAYYDREGKRVRTSGGRHKKASPPLASLRGREGSLRASELPYDDPFEEPQPPATDHDEGLGDFEMPVNRTRPAVRSATPFSSGEAGQEGAPRA